MGLTLLAATAIGSAALTLPSSGPVERATTFLAARQQPDGGFAEPGQRSTPTLTAWAALALAARGRRSEEAADYLAGKPTGEATDVALRALALVALGRTVDDELARLDELRRPDGRIGPLVNSTVWGVLALRADGRPAGAKTVRYLRRQQARSGGWSWAPRGAPDTTDTAVAVEALRAAGVPSGDGAVRRGLAYLRRLRNRDGGFPLLRGRASDAQSTSWVLQAFAAARRRPPAGARAYLFHLQRPDGSFRYSARYAVTPVWVTAQVVPALAGRPFPL